MSPMPEWLPPLSPLEDYGGDWESYVEALYAFFKKDFVENTVLYKGNKIVLKRHPVVKGKEATFWHLISEGNIEETRSPNLRRCERIRWVKALIDHCEELGIKVWENERKNEKRVCIWYEEVDYLVVLAKRKGYTVLWTAYLVTKKHTKEKMRKEYEAYKNADAAHKDGIVTPSTRGR